MNVQSQGQSPSLVGSDAENALPIKEVNHPDAIGLSYLIIDDL